MDDEEAVLGDALNAFQVKSKVGNLKKRAKKKSKKLVYDVAAINYDQLSDYDSEEGTGTKIAPTQTSLNIPLSDLESDDEEDEVKTFFDNLSAFEIQQLNLSTIVRENKPEILHELLYSRIYKTRFRQQLSKQDTNGLTPLQKCNKQSYK